MTISKETVEEMKLATKADEPTEKHDGVNLLYTPGHIDPECWLKPGNIQRCIKPINLNEINKLYMALHIQYETIEHKGKKYKTADILDGLAAVAQHYSRAGRNTPKIPQNNENIPVREEMTVAQLRERLKQGDGAAQELVNDLISELPNQITSWITKDIAQKYNGGDLTPEQFEDFWCFLRHEWELLDTCEELRSALEHWSTECADE